MASTATRPPRSSHRPAYQSQSSPPEQRRSSKRRNDFELDDVDEGVEESVGRATAALQGPARPPTLPAIRERAGLDRRGRMASPPLTKAL